MSNNVTLNPGSGGDTVWADDVDNIKIQGVKLVTGGENVGQYGTSVSRKVCAGTSADETEAKSTAGVVYGVVAVNVGTADAFLHLYNATAANVTVGTTTPHITIPLLADGGAVAALDLGIAFSTAITYAVTTTVGGSTGVTADSVVVNILYA